MLISNINIYKFNSFKNYTKVNSNPISYGNHLAPLKQDMVSFKGSSQIKFENVNFKEKFNKNDLDIVNKIARFANKTGVNIYLVGGIVRDMLLGENANDIDFLIEGDAIEFTKAFAKEHPDSQIEYLKDNFGTTKLRINDEDIDIASTREESYIRKTIPQISNIGCFVEKDLKRRDFTINSMALKLELDENCEAKFIPVDIVGGLKDLNSKIISATYANSFNDDPTRILRGLKFRLRYGFKYDDKTQKMQDEYLANPPRDEISLARIDTVLRKLFHDKEMAPLAFDAIVDEGLYRLFASNLLAQSGWGSKIQKACDIFEIDHINDMVNVYIKLLNNEIVAKTQELHTSDETKTNYDIYKKFNKFSKIELAIYYVATNDEDAVKFYTELKDKAILLKRKDLNKIGLKKGEERNFALDTLLRAKLDNENIKTIEDEKSFIEKLMS